MFIFTRTKSHPFLFHFLKFTFFLWLRNIKRNVSMRHCELVVIPYLASPIANSKWGWGKRGGVE